VAYSGEGAGAIALLLWSDREFLDTYGTVFVSSVSRLNRKIRVPRILVTVRVFCLLKPASECIQAYHFWDNDYFSEQEPSRPSPPHHTLSTPTAPRPLLTEILNTPLQVTLLM